MTTLKIPFTLEQEARYRQYFWDVLDEEAYQNPSFQRRAGVLVNMALFELVKLINDIGFNPVEDDITQLDRCADFSFLEAYSSDWLYDEDFKPYRLLIEEREKKLTGKVSNPFNDFKQIVGAETRKNTPKKRRKKPLGFGKSK